MKKRVILTISILFMIFPLLSAVEIDMKENISNGETLLAKISGNFLEPLQKENIFLYREHIRVSFDPELTKINDDYYLYSQLLEKSPGNYSLRLQNVRYMDFGESSEEEVRKNFSITEEKADFTVEPGFIITDKDFFIKVQNLQNYEITINSKWGVYNDTGSQGFFESFFGSESSDSENEKTTILDAGEIKNIDFEIPETNESTLKSISLRTQNLTYEIPVFVENTETKEEKFSIFPTEINVSLSTNSNITRTIRISNPGDTDLTNVSLFVSEPANKYISFSQNNINLEKNSDRDINLTISSNNTEEYIEGQITANTEELYAYTAISLNFTQGFIPEENESEESIFQTCNELGGVLCNETQECAGNTTGSKDGICCLAQCEKIEKSNTGAIVGWVIIIAIIGFLAWFFLKKYKKTKNPLDLLKIAKGKNKKK